MMLNRVSLNTIGLNRIGLNRIGKPSRGSSDRPYIDPEVLASLKAVCICYGKSNDDPDRAIVKNLVDPDNPFVISNAAFKLNSGFGKYSADFESFDWAINISQKQHNKATISLNGRLCNHTAIEIDEMKVNIIGNVTELIYWYIANPDDTTRSEIRLTSGINTLPKSYAKDDGQTYNIGFAYISGDSEITIEQIPSFEGAFVTDGIDDLITSTKTVSEMGVTNEITVISMIHQIALNSTYNIGTTNYLENLDNGKHIRSDVYYAGKTGIYGYTASLINNTASDIKNILGDKADYSTKKDEPSQALHNSKFSVVGRARNLAEPSSVAWYWTIIANKVLTTDQINQVIAYFNLDRTLKYDIYCNIAKQGITNENHAEFGDKLIDFSGNGRDIQMYNLAWKGGSGVAAKQYETFKDWTSESSSTSIIKQIDEFTRIVESTTNGYWVSRIKRDSDLDKVYSPINVYLYQDNNFLVHECKYEVDGVKYAIPINEPVGKGYHKLEMYTKDRYTELPENAENVVLSEWYFPKSTKGSIKYSIIPSCKGGILLDGINDFGKVTGMPIYKDYTFISKYQRLSYREAIETEGGAVIASKSYSRNQGAFIFNGVRGDYAHDCYSFGLPSSNNLINDKNLEVYYQTKYTNQGKSISSGTAADSDILWLGTVRDNDNRFINAAIYSFMSFPYSMSKFLIERQLKKHKLGTLYPDMVEFRPVIKANNDYEIVYTAIIKPNNWQEISVGDYVTVGESVAIQIKLNNPLEVTNVSSNSLADVSFYKEETSDNVYTIYGRLLDGKSPQKISLTIEQDENYVLFNPTINSNAVLEVGNEETMPELFTQLNNGEIDGIILYMQGDKAVLPNNWIDKNTKVRAIIYCLDTVSEEDIHFTVDGKTKYCYSAIEDGLAAFGIMDEDSQEEQYMTNVLTANTIDIQLDQYIRYEDIVQPYPVLLRFNDENGNEVSWGGKFRVGSTITRIGSFYENNLIDGLYIVRNPKLNGNNLITPTHVVEKSMVFTCDTEYLLDNNEPKCILSPSRLRMPNSSYKILGYIPDISGHGNHGVIHNSAYAGMSGANGYLQNFSGWTKASGVSSTDSVISSSNNLVAANGWIAYVTSGNVIPTFKVEISGIPVNGNLRFEGSDQVLVNGVNTIQGLTTTKVSGFYISNGYDNDWSNLRIEQIGEYEGAYCLDGVDDFVTIPTVTGGGKQVLMKVNNNTINSMLYDQRSSGASPNSLNSDFAIYNTNTVDNNLIAYQSRLVGKTYIDGILNTNITCEDLLGVLHNITITCDIVAPNNGVVPNIGRGGVLKDLYSKVALYDFMLFDSISTDDKIKELNEYIGIEPKVELPPYYWDAYGKTNLDEDKNYTANLGTVKDVIEVSQPAIFAENWYDGNPEPVLSSPIINQTDYSIEVKANKMDNNFTMMLDVECDTPLPAFKAKFSMVGTAISVDLKYYINGGSKIIDVFKSGGSTEPVILDIPASERSFIYGTNTDNYPNILIEILPADNGTRYGLTNTNFAYDKMSGYGGYNLSRFDKSWASSSSSNTSIKVVQRNPYDITLKKLGGNSDWEFNNTELKVISNPVSVKFKSNKNIRVTCDYHYYPVGGNSEGTPLGITSKDLIANKDAIITISPISQENIDKYNIDVNRGYYLIYFQLSSTLAVNEEVTIEMLPLYPNGLVYDGVTDYSENANIPALTDYTYIFKRDILGFNPRSVSMHKGTSTNAGRAFTSDYDYGETNEVLAYSFGSSIATPNATSKKIIYGTKTSVDGQPITPGSNIDDAGLFIGKWYDDFFKKMVFYKLILYPKTIPLLQINFLKNLMEKDEIIDLNNKIFIQE